MMMKISLILLGIGMVPFIITTAHPRLPADPASTVEIESDIQKLVSKNKPPALSVAIIKDGQIVYRRAFGWADGPAQLPAATDTVYHWWSMTKVPTALAVLQLHDAKQLDLDDPVRDYLPFFQVELKGKPAPPITIRQLLRHTSGLPDIIPAMIGWVHYDDEIYNQTDLLKQHLPRFNRLKFAPDSRASYSNLGYMVLGAIIESVSGVRYETYIQDHILAPLGMTDTGFLYSPQMAGKIAAGSHPILSVYTPLLPFLVDMKALVNERVGGQFWLNPVYTDVTPSSGLIGSADDAALFAQALLTRSEILSPDSHLLLLPGGSTPTERPLGWAEFNAVGRKWVQHSGGGPGFATIMRIYPDENLGIVIMANNTNLPREALVEAFASLDW
jgi:D-alanyl-D-alanine carboxypeptidase